MLKTIALCAVLVSALGQLVAPPPSDPTDFDCEDIQFLMRERTEFLDAIEKQFVCIYGFEEKIDPVTPKPGVEKTDSLFTEDELDVLAAVYQDLVVSYLMWHAVHWEYEPQQLIVRLGTARRSDLTPPDDFLNRITTDRVLATNDGVRSDTVLPCTVRLWSWIGPDSAFVRAGVSGMGGCGVSRCALVVRKRAGWRVCPAKTTIRICV
jgi:hypothetical protein